MHIVLQRKPRHHVEFPLSGRLRVNMGNICVEQGKHAKALKMYRMALDQISDVHKGVRLKIFQNIGTVFVKMGRYADAITSFEHIMEERADFKTGNDFSIDFHRHSILYHSEITPALNLMLCYFAISDSEKMKKCFHRMLQISTGIDEDRYYPTMVCECESLCQYCRRFSFKIKSTAF